MRVLSLFSGVGGFDMGLEAAGMTTVFQCEIDKKCQEVLAHHWPDVPKWDDVSTLTGAHVLNMTGGVDVVAWGSPCQDLSVAGKRAGLGGERSGLFHQGIRIIKEMRELSNGQYPTWSLWENVAGALSSNSGADFGQVLYEMDEAGACFSEWALLDAQHFGVPQRRRRIFVASCFDSATSARCPEPLFPVSESLPRNPATGTASREDVAAEVADSVGGGGSGNNVPVVAQPPILSFDTQFGSNANVFEDASPTLKSSQQSPSIMNDQPTLVVRRLSPLECERLMGWPDNHTAQGVNGTITDTNRYKMCGNGVASPVATWLGRHLMATQ